MRGSGSFSKGPSDFPRLGPRDVPIRNLFKPGCGLRLVGAGIGPGAIDQVIGIAKAI